MYTVTWDGKLYECVAYEADRICIGNITVDDVGPNTGEPFFYYYYDDGDYGLCVRFPGIHTIEVSCAKVVKLDKKYVPDLGLSPVAKSGSYYDLDDTPTIYIDVVRFSANQNLTKAQKKIARNNISAASSTDIDGMVKYTYQYLTDAQKQQVRTNIGAGTSNFSGSYNDLTDKPKAVQSDWENSNTDDAAYIKNRTHYVETIKETLLETSSPPGWKTVTGGKDSNSKYLYCSINDFNGNFNVSNLREGLSCQVYYTLTKGGCSGFGPIKLYKSTVIKDEYEYVYWVFGDIYYYLKDVTYPPFYGDISTTPSSTVNGAGYIAFVYHNGELQSDNSGLYLITKPPVINGSSSLSSLNISIVYPPTVHQLDEKYIPSTIQRVGDEVILPSSTSGSDKKFKITVNDSGALTATEVTE